MESGFNRANTFKEQALHRNYSYQYLWFKKHYYEDCYKQFI